MRAVGNHQSRHDPEPEWQVTAKYRDIGKGCENDHTEDDAESPHLSHIPLSDPGDYFVYRQPEWYYSAKIDDREDFRVDAMGCLYLGEPIL
jgi:hypothetical protein